MRYSDFSDIGGFLWWIFVRFCKTDLEEEQSKNYWARNIVVLAMVFFGLVGVSIVFFEN